MALKSSNLARPLMSIHQLWQEENLKCM